MAIAKLESGMRTGWLYNYHNTSEEVEGEDGKDATSASAMQLLFQDLDGNCFEATLKYNPYFLVAAAEGHEREVELGIWSSFGQQLVVQVTPLEKEDLDLVNHLSGRKKLYIKVQFRNTQDLTAVRAKIDSGVKRNKARSSDNPLSGHFASTSGFSSTGLFGMEAEATAPAGADSLAWMNWVTDLREYDVKYHVRVAIDLGVYVGVWYDVYAEHGVVRVDRCDDSKYAPAMPRVCAFDIETTKAPLKFPQPEVDKIYMISYMIDGRGFLIVNREIVAEDIQPFEYTPKPEYEGFFDTFNEPDEYATLRRFFDEMKLHRPHVYVTYNGDYFDFPFIHARSLFHGMNMRQEIGFAQGAEGATLNKKVSHLDCFYWVKRDSYLPQGSQGLKAVTKYKLGYDPIEVDPEDMLPLAQTNPQQMASYSVSDAVSTYYLYMKYVHPFIFSLCTIIPMPADEVLRKGSGTLCESLLMVQAYLGNVVFPNKKVQENEKFYNGHLIDSETYIGGHVEALQSGIFRSNIPMHFKMNREVFDQLINRLDDMLKFALEVEAGASLAEITNFEEIKNEIAGKLAALRDQPDRVEPPLIYHLDVGAMYPNIILTNRLQPSAMIKPETCAGCCFNSPENNCQRHMEWIWKGEMFTATKQEYVRIKTQLEGESFGEVAVEKANQAATTKQTYGNRKGNVLEGTAYEKKEDDSWRNRNNNRPGAGSSYRKMGPGARREDALRDLIDPTDNDGGGEGSSSDDGGNKKFHKLEEKTQFSMIKKRLGEYSRKAYGKTHDTREVHRIDTVCQRENSFYVDTVRLFRDRRYHYKRELKKWKDNLDKAKDAAEVKEAKSRCVQMESLQLAHKCILNSFYGYVMRKGSRWGSMEMAGIVTYLGANLITIARQLVQQLGVTLELDTDGIWCCLPKSFPENFVFTTANPKKKFPISFPCVMLNKDVHDKYTNHQYQTLVSTGVYKTHSECSIYFEVDGPYLAMVLPASREEGGSIKKRYAVFHPDGRLAELKGFELKRRGELMLVKDFQGQVFKRFLDGSSLAEAYESAAVVANSALDMLYNKGEGYDDDEVVEKLTESSNMTRRLSEYPVTQKSLALTTARRISEFLGPQMVKDKGLSCQFIISRTPVGKPVTDRAIPLSIFKASPVTRATFLRKWTGDNSLSVECSVKPILDWEYYIGRFNGCVQKIITIPAALQGIANPVPRVKHPDWLQKKISQRDSRFRQTTLTSLVVRKHSFVPDVEDLGVQHPPRGTRAKVKSRIDVDSSDMSDDDVPQKNKLDAVQRLTDEAIQAVQYMYFTPASTRTLDAGFFGSSDSRLWLGQQRERWIHRARLRQEIAVGNESSTKQQPQQMAGNFIDTKSKALTLTWHILEVRAMPETPNCVRLFVLLDKIVYVFRCLVDRTVIVNLDPSSPGIPNARPVVGRVLPRHTTPGTVVEVTVNNEKDSGDAFVERLLYLREDVRGVFEHKLSLVDRFVMDVGPVVAVREKAHLANTRSRPASQRDIFTIPELEPLTSAAYLPATPSYVFIYHASLDTRGILCAAFKQTGKVHVVVIQPAAAVRPNLQWTALMEEACSALGFDLTAQNINTPTMEFAPDISSGWRLLNGVLVESANAANKPALALVQSPVLSSVLLRQHLPQLHSLAMTRLLGAGEDEKLFANAFQWTRNIARRFLQRLVASQLWLEEKLRVARTSHVSLCNIGQDSSVSALDFMYSRALRRHSHVLWDSSDPAIALEQVEERPRRVVCAGGHYTWCVEFSLTQIDVVSILFSQMIQENDDPRAQALCDLGVTSHFRILRDMLSELTSVAAAKQSKSKGEEDAMTLLVSVARWLRDTVSMTYEPAIVSHVSALVHRAITALLIRVTKLGGRIVKASSTSLIVACPKYALSEAKNFAHFVAGSMKDIAVLNHLSLTEVRFWRPLLVRDHNDYCGFFISADDANGAIAKVAAGGSLDLSAMTYDNCFTVWTVLDHDTRRLFAARIQSALILMWNATEHAASAVAADPVVTLATYSEKVTERLGKILSNEIDETLQTELIAEVQNMIQQKVHLIGKTEGVAALEYVKAIMHILDSAPNINSALRMTKNNCLRICGVGPFSPAALFELDPSAGVLLQSTRCSFCNEEVVIDVTKSGVDLRCPECTNPFTREAIEGHLVRRVNQLVTALMNQDFVCSKCNRVTNTLLTRNCCGELVGKARQSVAAELLALQKLAVGQQFQWLAEVAECALSCTS